MKGVVAYCDRFEYAWSPVTERPRMIEWMDFRKNECTSPHIRLYSLSDDKEEEFSALMDATVDSPYTAALILVNTKDNFEVDAKFLPPNKRCGFPVAVVQHSIGPRLRGMFLKHRRELEARMKIKPQGFLSIRQLLSWARKPVVELVAAVQGLLFPPDGEERIASEDSDLFVMVMDEFDRVETGVCYIGCILITNMLPCCTFLSRVEIRLRPARHC